MASLRHLGLLVLLLSISPLFAASNRILVLPAISGGPVSVVQPDGPTPETTFVSPLGAFKVLQDGAGDTYFILSNRASQAVTVVAADSLETLIVIPLGTGVSDGVVTPDGRYLLLSAGSLIVVDLKTYEIVDTIAVGGSARRIIVNRASTIAYVIGGTRSQRQIHAVDLQTFDVVAETAETDGMSDMVLVEGESLMVAAADSRMLLFSPGPLTKITDFEPSPRFNEAEIDIIPGGTRVLVRGTGRQSNNASLMFDWTSGDSQIISPSTDNIFSAAAVLDASTTFAVRSSDNKAVLLDTTAPLYVTVVPLNLGVKAIDLGFSPDRQQLYVVAEDQNQILKYDSHTLSLLGDADLEVAPRSAEFLFIPGDLPPGSLITLSGDHQFGIPNVQLEFPFTVQLRDILEQPVLGQDVLFEDLTGLGFQFKPSNLVKTDDQGIATVTVRVPPRAAFGTPAANIEQFILSATAPNVRPKFFDVRVVHEFGIKAVSGEDQVVSPNQDLPKRLVVSAVRANGNPVAAGTVLSASAIGGACIGEAAVNTAGFASVQCRATALPPGNTQKPGSITLSALQFAGELGTENTIQRFNFTTFSGANGIQVQPLSGDGQTAPTGVPLLAPLTYKVTNESTNIVIPVMAEASRFDGPPASFSPRRSEAFPGVSRQIAATTGKYPGTAVIQVEAAAPGLSKTNFTIEILPEAPSFLTKKNDGQEGKILSKLTNPLEVAVFGQSGNLIPFPLLEWDVVSGSASVSALTTSTGSRATVNLGPLAGAVVIRASVGQLTATFNINVVGPEPDQITLLSGQGQSLTPGTLSEPISVLLFEDGAAAAGSIVTFSGPPSLVFHPLGIGTPANPLITNADLEGRAVARVELVPVGSVTEQGAAQQQTTAAMVTATVSAGTVSRDVLFGVIGRQPQFTSSSLVNAASFRPGIVPGGLATIFGTGLMEAISKIVLPSGVTSFNGTTVRIAGIAAPLLALAPGALEQINFQVPFEIPPGQLVSVEVENNGTKTTVQNVAVFSVQPGIFEVPQGQGKIGAVLHADDGSLVTAANPADLGEALSLYFTGGGALNDPGAATGVLGPADPPLTTAGTTDVLLAGVKTEVLFSGYAPFFMGLYQANFVVPPDALCGQLSLAVVVSATPSPASMINVKCP